MKKPVEEKFSEFYEKWVCHLQELVLLVRSTYQEPDYTNLVAKFTTHYKDYYKFKWASAKEDVLAFFSPTWLTPLEKAYLWVTGWRPSIVFQFIDPLSMDRQTETYIRSAHGSSVIHDLNEYQLKKIDELKVMVRFKEEEVEREMERHQVSLADRRIVELARLTRAAVDHRHDDEVAVEGMVEVVMKGLMGGLEKVMKMADCVRLKTLKEVLDILDPKQSVELLAAISMFQVLLRKSMTERRHA